MNSYNSIINELITQKQTLDEKGFTVTTANTYPSPSEITSAIKNINLDLSDSTATEADVVAGKTFYSKTHELKTGTLEASSSTEINDYLTCLISGRGQTEIIIPETVTQIRPYAFAVYTTGCDKNIFSHENFTIPPHVEAIYEYAFMRCNLTGTLTIPSTVKELYSKPFQYTKISKCIIDTQLTSKSTDLFSQCEDLETIELTNNITTLYKKNLGSLKSVYEVILPASITTIADGTFYSSTSPTMIKFLNTTPISISTGVFSDVSVSVIAVPINAYYTYYNTTNYLASGNVMVGFDSFNAGDTFPTTISGMSVAWFDDPLDARYDRVRITECPSDGEYYARFI